MLLMPATPPQETVLASSIRTGIPSAARREVGGQRACLARAGFRAQQQFDRRRRRLRAPERVVVAREQRRPLRQRVGFAPVDEHARAGHIGPGDRHAGRERVDRFAVAGDFFLICLREPRRRAEAVAAVGVRLVADLDGREAGPEVHVRRGDLARGRERFVMGESDGQQHLPAAATGEFAELAHLRGPDRARRPRGTRGLRVRPGDVLIGGDPAEAQQPGPDERSSSTRSPRCAYCPSCVSAAASKESPRKWAGTGLPGSSGLTTMPTGTAACAARAAACAVGARAIMTASSTASTPAHVGARASTAAVAGRRDGDDCCARSTPAVNNLTGAPCAGRTGAGTCGDFPHALYGQVRWEISAPPSSM